MTNQKHAIILMTALLPTTGHTDIIEFAKNLPNTTVHVLINGRTFEPLSGELRRDSIFKFFHNDLDIQLSIKDDAPQNPGDMKEGFWNWWKNEINQNFPEVHNWDYVVASESYGENVAKSLNAQFIPYDIERFNNNAKGTSVRLDIWNEWESILPYVREKLMFKAAMFGQESVGKTTLSKIVAENLNSRWIVEWARPYLETVGEDLSLQKMSNIHHGQAALQKTFFKRASTPALILDTDLFSTIGYYRIMREEIHSSLIEDAKRLSSNIYYILPDDIPLVKDPLRYGGDKRESNMGFWIELLEEFGQEYVIVPSGSISEKSAWISADIKNQFEQQIHQLKSFNRS